MFAIPVLAQAQKPKQQKTVVLPAKHGAPHKWAAEMDKYVSKTVKQLGLEVYYDMDEALEASKRLKKPVMVEFTGVNNVNARKMEQIVWSSPDVAARMRNNFVLLSLYCDVNQIKLPLAEQYYSKELRKQIVSLGDKNNDIQATNFFSTNQPSYFFINEKAERIIKPGYYWDPEPTHLIREFDKVMAIYKKGVK